MLNEEQSYVVEIAEELGVRTKFISHKNPTISCAEKLALLRQDEDYADWTLDRIVKALYFNRNGGPFVGIITPEFGRRVDQKQILRKALGISGSQAERYHVHPRRVPNGMTWGTCTPFPLSSSVGNEISDLVVINHEPIRDKLVDISVGGTDKEKYRLSMHLPYKAIHKILAGKFGDRIHVF